MQRHSQQRLPLRRQDALALLTLLVALASTPAAAQEQMTPEQNAFQGVHRLALPRSSGTGAAHSLRVLTVEGEIQSIDAPTRSFELVDGKQVHTIKYSPDTEFELDGKKVTAKQALAKGREVKVVKRGDVVRSVRVTSKQSVEEGEARTHQA